MNPKGGPPVGNQRPKEQEAVELVPIGKSLYKIVVHDEEAIHRAAREALRFSHEEPPPPSRKRGGWWSKLRSRH